MLANELEALVSAPRRSQNQNPAFAAYDDMVGAMAKLDTAAKTGSLDNTTEWRARLPDCSPICRPTSPAGISF